MVKITSALNAFDRNAFFKKVFMDVDQAAAREYLFEFIAIELIQASATTDHDRLNIEVIERVCDPMEEVGVIVSRQ